MKEVIVEFHVEDHEAIESIPDIKQVWEYLDADHDKMSPREWASLFLEKYRIRFIAKKGDCPDE